MITPPTILIALAMALPKIECASECANTLPDNIYGNNPLEVVFDCLAKNLANSLSVNTDIAPAKVESLLDDVEGLLEVKHYQIWTIKF